MTARVLFTVKLITLMLTVSSVSGCLMILKAPPTEPSIEQLSQKEVYSYQWSDDMDFASVETAARRSMEYFRRLPQDRHFEFGNIVYSPAQMERSLALFIDIVNCTRGDERDRLIREKFDFFESRNTGGNAFFTGYYEPLLEGRLVPEGNFNEPVYARPADLVEVDLGLFADKWKKEKIVGKVEGRLLLPYDSRNEIVYGKSLKSRAEVIAYVNGIELFFLQIQGSGLILLPDGNVKRVNYAGKNGHPYRAIGEVLRDKIPAENMSMQSIKEYLYSNPDDMFEIMNYNQSYTFFREIEEGPLGNINVVLAPGRSIAMDSRIIPQGGLAFVETEIPVVVDGKVAGWRPVRRFVLVQDTGGAIRGHGRVDIFFGNGSDAEIYAGHMKQGGRCFLLVAKKEFLDDNYINK